MRTTDSLIGGLAGAALLTATHETLRRVVPAAPRMDRLGMEALRKLIAKSKKATQPDSNTLFWITMAGDLVSNSLYYSLGGTGNGNPVWRSTLLGLAAGIGGVFLPGPLGLSERHSGRTLSTQLLTVGLYTLGGLAAGLALKWLQKKREPKHLPGSLIL